MGGSWAILIAPSTTGQVASGFGPLWRLGAISPLCSPSKMVSAIGGKAPRGASQRAGRGPAKPFGRKVPSRKARSPP
jgi:hypothetical protein